MEKQGQIIVTMATIVQSSDRVTMLFISQILHGVNVAINLEFE